jgi:hypothetical protein
LNSSSDRRIPHEEDPDPNQTARDRQSQHDWPGNAGPLKAAAVRKMTRSLAASLSSVPAFSFEPRRDGSAPITFNSINSVTFNRNAYQGPARFAFQLEARPGHFTILNDVSGHTEQLKFRYAFLQARRPPKAIVRLNGGKSGDN